MNPLKDNCYSISVVNGQNDSTDGNLWVTEFGALVINNVTRDDISLYTLQYIDSKGQQYLHTFIVIGKSNS